MSALWVFLGVLAAMWAGWRIVRASVSSLAGSKVAFVAEPIPGRIKKPRKGERL